MVSDTLKVILYVTENDSKYRDVAFLTILVPCSQLRISLGWGTPFLGINSYVPLNGSYGQDLSP